LLERKFQSIEPFIVDPKRNAFCIQCGNLATKLVKYGTEGSIKLEKYCDNAREGSSPIQLSSLYQIREQKIHAPTMPLATSTE
jgi:hypothetical protein